MTNVLPLPIKFIGLQKGPVHVSGFALYEKCPACGAYPDWDTIHYNVLPDEELWTEGVSRAYECGANLYLGCEYPDKFVRNWERGCPKAMQTFSENSV